MFRADAIVRFPALGLALLVVLGGCTGEPGVRPSPRGRTSTAPRGAADRNDDALRSVPERAEAHRVPRGLPEKTMLPTSDQPTDTAQPHTPEPDAAVPSVPPPSMAAASALSPKLTRPAPPVLVALGDLHGDLAATRRALRLAGAIDENDHWSGGELVLVQTGDILDRGDDDRAILDLLLRLKEEARQTDGEVLVLSGNHELMNVQQNFYYVTPGGFDAFRSEGGREAVFRPGGAYALKVSELPVFVKVGDSVFVHGGVLPKHIAYGLDRMNDQVQRWMRGELSVLPSVMADADGPMWTRLYSLETDAAGCEELTRALNLLGAKRMVVGHTPQLSGITSACDERVWRIDVGMSRYYGGPVEVLEIRGDRVRVLRSP